MAEPEKQKQALIYAMNKLNESPLLEYIDKLILYGSCARGTADEHSDVDLLLVLRPECRNMDMTQFRDLKTVVVPTEPCSCNVDLRISIGDDWKDSSSAINREILKDGIVLWG